MSRLRTRTKGEVIGPYILHRFLGSGVEGDVYLVNDVRDGQLRTLKILRGRNRELDAEHTAAHYRKLSRVASLKRFREWGVMTGQGSVGNRPWLAFDYIAGETLAKRIETRRVGNPLNILLAVCSALGPIHRRGFAIGDFDRARNLLVERSTGLIRFCDLDAGGPEERPPGAETDMDELAALSRRLWRASGAAPRRDVCSVLVKSGNAIQARHLLTQLPSSRSARGLSTGAF